MKSIFEMNYSNILSPEDDYLQIPVFMLIIYYNLVLYKKYKYYNLKNINIT